MGVNIVNGADSDYVSARRFNTVEQSLAKRLRRIILTIGRTGKRPVFLSHKRTGDNSPDIIRLNIFVSNLAKPVKSVQTEMIFMGGNLHIAVGRSIENRFARPNVLFAKLLNNHRTRSGFIAENAGNSAFPDDIFNHFRRKRRIIRLKVPPTFEIRQSRHFPMSGNRIFVHADFFGMPVFRCHLQPRCRLGADGRILTAGTFGCLRQP